MTDTPRSSPPLPSPDTSRWPRSADGTSEIFTQAVTLTETTPEHFDRAFTAVTQPCPWPKAYGGDLVAQAVVAAIRTVDGKHLHSTHSYFMRPAEIGAEVRYEVELLRDGRGYSTRQVRGYQGGKPIFVCLTGFAAGEPGGELQSELPADIKDPETLPSSATYLSGRSGGTMTEQSRGYWSAGRSFDIRHVPDPVYLTVDGEHVPHQAVWVRPFDALREVPGLDDRQRDTAALSYVCDYTILEPTLRALGLAWADEGLVTASLDHSMWFHRSAPVEGWLLYAQEAISASDGRGLNLGRFFTPDGTHLATVLQEGMIRSRTGAPR
ncbi:acyl-CoA thioesterase [Flexivirga caeni]|uniref:Acyl-CoA thioesterase II n=1 Tax=Flexivirga caeni TaxID=2294115 RepID=A0A3M9MBH5_9MICO|nr:acyl-CoA thioesterase domain-containing protein [Flexivirga caeni]RNI22922.1 acyl-CoA thioesterase II [Flexivirga caeni]